MAALKACRWRPWQLLLVGWWWWMLVDEVLAMQHSRLVTVNKVVQTPLFKRLLEESPVPSEISQPPAPHGNSTDGPPPPARNGDGPDNNRPPPPPGGHRPENNHGPPPPDDHGDGPGPKSIIQTVDNGDTQLTQTFPCGPPGGGPGGGGPGGGGGPLPGPPPNHPPPPGENICGQKPFLLTRNDDGGDTSNGNCDNAANSSILSCTCFDELNVTDTKEWSFLLAPKRRDSSSTEMPTSLSLSGPQTPLQVSSITTLRVPAQVQAIRFIGDGETPATIKFALSGADAVQLLTLSNAFGETPQLSTVEISNLDMFKVVLANGFVPRSITNLTMSNCNLSAIYTGFLTGFQQLAMLDISKNHLTNIFDGLLQGSCGSASCSIQELNLNNNNFTKIPELLMGLTNLKIVRMSGNPIHYPPTISNDLFKFIEKLDLFEFNATAAGDPIQDNQVHATNGSSCGNNGVVQQVHNVAFCVSGSTSSPNASSGSNDGTKSVLVLALIILGAILLFVVLVWLMKCGICRSSDGSDFTFTSRVKHTQDDGVNSAGVYGAGDGTERSKTNGYELFDGEEDTYGNDDEVTGIDLSLLRDPFLVTARIPFDAIRFGNCMKKGGFGVVYNGIYNRRKIAIKKLRNDRSGNLRNVENFIKEVCLIASLKHPRIVEFIGVAWDSLRNFCAITELMEKGDLKQVLTSFSRRSASSKAKMRKLFLRKRATAAGFQNDGNGEAPLDGNSPLLSEGPQSMEFPEFSWQNHKRHIMSHVAEALTYLHSLQPKIIHRDLKSKNILLNNAMEAKLSDFGIARERKIDESHMMTAGVGTSFWIAPEVLLGKDYDERADIFSFGVVMCEMDTGEYPYRQMNQIAQAAQQAEGGSPPKAQPSSKYQCTTILQLVAHGQLRPEMSVYCPLAIASLAADCLAMDPAARPTAAEIVYRLSQLQLQGEAVSSLSDGEDISIMEDVEEE